MIAAVRERVARFIGGTKRANPVQLTSEVQGEYYGPGLGSSQPDTQSLLRENLGVSDMATRAIANRIASLNPIVKVSRRDSNGTLVDEELDDHILKLLLDRPHPDFTRQQLLRLTAQWVVTTGDGYWLKVNNGFGAPMMLQPIPPNIVEPVLKNSVISEYRVTDANGITHPYEATDLIRFWFPDPETLYSGEGYLGPNAVVADTHKFASEHLRNRYQNDATPPTILKGTAEAMMPSDPQFERWQREFKRKYASRGGTHAGLPVMMPPGWEPIFAAMQSGADITPLLEYLQSNQLMNFGVPQSVLGRVISGDRSSAETNQFVFDLHTIKPIAEMIEQALTYQLASAFDAALFVEFEEFVSDDKDFELKREAQDLALKVRTVQQILEDRGDDPEVATWGEYPVGTLADQPYTGEIDEDSASLKPDEPGALFEDEDAEDDVPDAAADDGSPRSLRAGRVPAARLRSFRAGYFSPESEWKRVKNREKQYRPKMDRELRAIFDAQRRDVIKKLGRALVEGSDLQRVDLDEWERATADKLFQPKAWKKAFATRVEPVRKAAYVASANDALQGIGLGQEFVFTESVVASLESQAASLVTNTGQTTLRRLRKALVKGAQNNETPAQLTKRVNEVFKGRRRNAATIARTELHRATQDAQIESFDQSGVVERKEWNDFGDDAVRDSHWDQYIEPANLRDPFVLTNGALAMYPGDPSLDPGDSINCRCFVTPLFEDEE